MSEHIFNSVGQRDPKSFEESKSRGGKTREMKRHMVCPSQETQPQGKSVCVREREGRTQTH